jgi:hypothetical protein
MEPAAAADVRAGGGRGAAGAGCAAGLWDQLPQDLQEVIVARAFASAAGGAPPPPLAARRLAAVDKRFAAQAARVDWAMVALRWDCRALIDGGLSPSAFAERVALAVAARERATPYVKFFPRREYQEIVECVNQRELARQLQGLPVESRSARMKLRDRMDGVAAELQEAFGQRGARAPPKARAPHQGVVARRLVEARLDEAQRVFVIGRLDRMFHGLNVRLRSASERPFEWGQEPRPVYVSVNDCLARDVDLLARA